MLQANLLSIKTKELQARVQASVAITQHGLQKLLLDRFGVQPVGNSRAALALQYARTACGMAQLRLAARRVQQCVSSDQRTSTGDATPPLTAAAMPVCR